MRLLSRCHVPIRAAALTAAILALLAPAGHPRAAAPAQTAPPRLVVLVVVDQFRADYVDWYGAHWTRGLRRLIDTGAVFANAAYPYANTVTCAGHATISTGAFPVQHGIAGNEFYDRALRRSVGCALDADATSVAFAGAAGRERYSSRSLLLPTFAEELRRQATVPPRMVIVGQKPRTAVMLTGKTGPDTITLWQESDGTWASSSAYTKTPWVPADDFIRAHPLANDYGQIWTRLLPDDAYQDADDAPGEGSPAPWGRTFPHPLISRTGQPDSEFVNAWSQSPWIDAYLTDLAIDLVRSQRLGTGTGTDYLAISFPALDHEGHEYGPRSHEVQDTLARVDANLGRLLDAIDAQVGAHYVIGLTADHGAALLPEQVVAEGGDGGRISTTGVRNAVNTAVGRALGAPGTYVASIYESQIALTPGVYDQLRGKAGAFEAVKTALRAVPGVAAAWAADELAAAPSTDPGILAWQLSYVPGRSGDFVLTPRPNWFIGSGTGTTHGTLHDYDQHVPLILAGAGIRPGRYTARSSPADIVVTFASLLGIQMPRAQGRALTEAIAR